MRKHIGAAVRYARGTLGLYRANIGVSAGTLPLADDKPTFVNLVGHTFDYRRPDAMMTARMGYCHGFESAGWPYRVIDITESARRLPQLNAPVCLIFAPDLQYVSNAVLNVLRDYPVAVWVPPWFDGSEQFFRSRGLDPSIWDLGTRLTRRVLAIEPRFVFTATVESGLGFFEGWERAGVPAVSLPLACDMDIYGQKKIHDPEFDGVELAFVGGYWQSKGRQLDRYLRPLEDRLKVYGYSKWPYRGYGGLLDAGREPSLYHQALISPAINEPTVALLKGQINERVFKVFGAGGLSITDAVPAYRELFAEDELLVPKDENQFIEFINELLLDADLRHNYREKGHQAVIARHTYSHRAETMMALFGLGDETV